MSGTGAQGLDLLVNNAGGYPISEDVINVDKAETGSILQCNAFIECTICII